MPATVTANAASIHRQAVRERLTSMGCRITLPLSGMIELALPQRPNTLHIHDAQVAIEVGYQLAQLVYPWPNWRSAQLDFRESYPAYTKYGAYPIVRRRPWQFMRRARKTALAAEVMQLRTTVIADFTRFQVELRPHTGHEYTLFMIPHELERPHYVTIGYLMAQFIYPHVIWHTTPLRVETDTTGDIICAVAVTSQR
jgi:hypothetical protein